MTNKVQIDETAIKLLKAGRDLIVRQNELLPYLAKEVKADPKEILYLWANRKLNQVGNFLNEWSYFFHGLECDIKNVKDGRFVRIDFGPKGDTATFTTWGLLQFVMTSKYPWEDYSALKTILAKEQPPYNQFSGSLERLHSIWQSLEENKLIEVADTNLLNLAEKYSSVDRLGIKHTNFPPNVSSETIIDCSVANRLKISQLGFELLRSVK